MKVTIKRNSNSGYIYAKSLIKNCITNRVAIILSISENTKQEVLEFTILYLDDIKIVTLPGCDFSKFELFTSEVILSND